ncbi:hypothetical protein [Halotalea alkalilenta]|uniref:Uncharacterized protein n=1 Tax=Halotalea alkalilenta TaxID=376489 RepID=A0A172YDX2_9GAMM|nr:hypothetical protein [Halotalea alkalilenta]ANF57461.1 hypothetical protein A5892_08275 [Halotalea alkalilenta]
MSAVLRVDLRAADQGRMLPSLGCGLWLETFDAAFATRLGQLLRPAHLDLLADARSAGWEARLDAAMALCAKIEAQAWLYLVLPDDRPEAALERLAARLDGSPVAGLLLTPAAYLKSYQPDAVWPSGPSPAELLALGRRRFPDLALGGGTPTYFTELNRCRPDPQAIDFITHATSPIIHAADDRSVMESLESLAHIVRSCRALAPGKPYRITTSAIGAWTNPYGRRLTPNDGLQRVTLSERDPRQRGLFAAAWALGYLAEISRVGGVDALSLASLGAPFAPATQSHPYPLYLVIEGILRGSRRTALEIGHAGGTRLAAVGWCEPSAKGELWLANLSSEPLKVELAGARVERGAALDLSSVERLCADFASLEYGSWQEASTIALSPFASVRLDVALVDRTGPA